MLGALRSRVALTAGRQLLGAPAGSLLRPASASASLLSPSSLSPSFLRCFASFTIPVPPIADSISEGTLAELTVAEGAQVDVDQVVAKLDTDKVSIDIRAPVAGKATKWHGKVGDNIKVGAPLLDVDTDAAGAPKGTSGSSGSAPAKPASPTQGPAGAPSTEDPHAEDPHKKGSPVAQSGAQAPTSVHPTDPADTHRRQPSIQFRFGKRDASGSVGGPASATHQHQGNQAVHVAGQDFLAANEAAAAAWDALPARYRKKGLKPSELDIIELGGAPNYERKQKKAKA